MKKKVSEEPSTKNKKLVIVESPTKAKTISRIMGEDYTILSSMGHIIDLPEKTLGVDIEKDFSTSYVVIPARQKVITALKKEGKDSAKIFVATDPDREGEAIGWQIKERLFKGKSVFRVTFHEITPTAIKEAFKNPREFDANMVEAQAGRRILDRLVGYFLSPLLWKKIARGLSAGRVQSVALRLVVEREREIQSFVPQEYWEIEAKLRKKAATANNEFVAKLEKIDDKKVEIKNKEEADGIVEALKGKEFRVVEVKLTEKKRNAEPPFITSTMQQEAFNKLKYNTTKTMIVAQQLYEGIDIGEENPVGLITYMRTDSVHVSAEAIKEVRNHIQERFGNDYLPEKPNTYKVKKLAQEAHEAIRPTLITRPAESVREFLTDEQYELYELIYNRFLASQMSPARFQVTSVDIKADGYHFGASGSKLVFNGFMAAYDIEEKEEKEKEKKFIPALEKDELLDLSELLPSQHFTKAPPRYSDSSLVKALEEDGIGRPSTYAPIISTLILRDYIRHLKGYFTPTELGFKVCDMLIEYFPKVMDINFTAAMEEELDEVEEGRLGKIKVLQDFYAPFKTSLEYAQANIKKEVIVSDQICDKCGKSMIVKWGRKGKFLSCSGFPACKNAKSITSGVKCPEPGCGGELIERRSRRGFFYGCSKFPTCRYTSRALPQSNDEG